MELYSAHLYHIRALSNMQAGAGGTNLGSIDNLVQRNAADGLPCINDTSLKGALREYVDWYNTQRSNNSLKDFVNFAFGSDERGEQKGAFIFPEASLLSIPIRSSYRPFFNGTSLQLLIDWKDKLDFFDCNAALKTELETFIEAIKTQVKEKEGLVFENISAACYFDDFDIKAKKAVTVANPPQTLQVPANIEKLFGAHLVVFTEEDFMELTNNKHLPVIPRNKLDNGESKNLWYEQVLPRETRFGFVQLVPYSDTTHEPVFASLFNGKVIQIGANASVGYGWSLITKM